MAEAKFSYKPLLVIFAVSLAFMLPAYVFGFGGHDAQTHGMWAREFSRLLSQGFIYPRYANEMTAGFGSFVFLFYPPVSLYLDSIFVFLGSDKNYYYLTIAAASNLALFCSGLAVFYWLKGKLPDSQRVLCAALYMALPVHLLMDFYITAVIAQFWCYVCFPLVLFGAEKIARGEKYGVALHAVSLALLAMTDIPDALVFIPFAAIYALVVGKNYLKVVGAWVLSIGLAAIYILPVLAYKHLVNIDMHWIGGDFGFKFSDYFLEMKLGDPAERYRIIIFVCFLITALYSLLFTLQMEKGKSRNLLLSFIAFAFFMCFSVSYFIWDNVPFVALIQFPRRFLIIPTVFIIPATASLLSKKPVFAERWILVLIFAMFYLDFGAAYIRVPNPDGDKIKIAKALYDNNVENYPNYLPNKEVIPLFYPAPKEEVINYPKLQVEGQGNAEISKWESRDIILDVAAKAGAQIKVRQFYFPYWKAYENGRELPISADNEFKIIAIKLPEALNGKLELKLKTLPAERLGVIISAISLLILVGITIRKRNDKI